MSDVATTMLERRGALAKQAQEIAQKAVQENRDLTADEAASFDKMMTEIDGLATRAKAIAEDEQRARDLEASFRGSGREAQRSAGDSSFAQWAREARMGDAFEILPVMGAERRALHNYREQRAMSAAGGIGPDGVYGRLWEYAVAGSQILQSGAEIINTAEGNTLPMPAVTAHATGASAAANAAITASDAGLTTVDLSVIKRGYLTLVPSELLQDATFDVEGYISRAAGRELGKIISSVAAAAVIAGFTTAGATGPGSTASGTFGAQATAGQGADLLISLYHSVLPEYRANGAWLMNDSAAAAVRRLKTSAGDYVWERALQAGTPANIEGSPVFYDPNLPTFAGVQATDAAKKLIYFGDFSALKVRIAGGLRFERSNEYAFGNDQVAFRALVRTGAVTIDANAVKHLVLG